MAFIAGLNESVPNVTERVELYKRGAWNEGLRPTFHLESTRSFSGH